MQFVTYATWEELPDSAERLFDQGAKQSIFLSRRWFDILRRQSTNDDASLLLVGVQQDDRLLALLPLQKTDETYWSAFTHLYSSLFSLLIAAEEQDQILQCLAQGLAESPVTTLKLAPVAEHDVEVANLVDALKAVGFESYQHFRFYNWVYRVENQSFAEYLSGRPTRVRNTVARKQRKLAREFGYDIQLYTDDDLEQGLADYRQVYRNSWKANEQFDSFVEVLAKTLAQQGWLRLAVLYIQRQPAAAQFWFVAHGKASIFKLAHDERWKKYSPGSILISFLMQQVIDQDRVEEIDFLTGNDAYKQDWMSERRQRFAWYLVKPGQRASRQSGWLQRLRDWRPWPSARRDYR